MPNSFLNLISIKGIGPISAAVFIATIGDINDFHRPEKLIPIPITRQTDGQKWKKSHNEVNKIVEV